MRRRQAAFPSGKTFGGWREEDSSIPPATQRALKTLEWISRSENLALAGPSGTGKSHFLEALGHAAIDSGLKVSTREVFVVAPAGNDAAQTSLLAGIISGVVSWGPITASCLRRSLAT